MIDGHQRMLTCKRLGIPIPDDKWELIESVTTIRDARRWMRDWQAGRRNWSPNEMALQAAEEYEEEKLAQGARTDLRGKAATDTAKQVGERYGKTDRWVREAVAFSNAVRVLRDNVGVDFPDELVQDERPPLTRDQVVAIAQAPADVQREALELVRKRNSADVIKVLGRAQRLLEGTAQRRSDKNDDKPAVSKFDLATLVYTIDTWSMEMVQGYNPVTDVRAASYLTMHLPSAIEKLIALAEANGLAGDVLDAYVARRIAAAQPEPTPEPAPEIPPPEPAPEIPPPEPAPEIPPPEPAPEIPPPELCGFQLFRRRRRSTSASPGAP